MRVRHVRLNLLMENVLLQMINFANKLHTWFLNLNDQLGLSLSDKELHFWIFGLSALVLFYFVRILFKLFNKLSKSIVAFLFTFVFLLAFAFANEMGQYYTSAGVMDFRDVISGINGFLVFFVIAFGLELVLKLFKH